MSTSISNVQPQSKAQAISYEIPPFSATASQLVAELNNSDVQVSRVVELIEYEPVIGGQVLQLANSPLYGVRRPITTIGHAVVILGFRSVAQHAIAVATGDVFDKPQSDCEAARKRTYAQSLSIATVARSISSKLGFGNPDESFLCGVLHDIGKLVLFEHAGARYEQMLNHHCETEAPRLENEAFGVSHPAVGKHCGSSWGLPSPINDAISNHHKPVDELADPLSKSIVIANYYARKWNIGFNAPPLMENESLEEHLTAHDEDELRDECEDQFQAIREICLN